MKPTPPRRPRGRPRELEAARNQKVNLGAEHWEKARAIGAGNASDGVRIALTAYPVKKIRRAPAR